MPIEIIVPRLGWSMEEGTFVAWLKQDGDIVRAGEALFSIEGDKAVQEIESIDSGILRIALNAPKPGEPVRVGTLLGHLLAEGEELKVSPGEQQDPRYLPAAEPHVSFSLREKAGMRGKATHDSHQRSEQAQTTQSAVPSEFPLPANAGRGVQRAAPPASRSTPAISPRALRVAAELGVDWSSVKGSGRTGRIREKDVRAAARPCAQGSGGTRNVISRRMLHSLGNTAPVTLHTTACADGLVKLRQQMKATAGTAKTIVPNYTDMITKLAAGALEQHPNLNAAWEGDNLVTSSSVDIGMAVDTEAGLLVPVLRDVTRLSLAEIADRAQDLIARARSRKLSAEEMLGGSFTITSLGAFGIDAFTPIINYPQCAILGIGRIRRQPIAEGDKLVLREIISLSLTFDHRALDGAPAARFLQTLTSLIEKESGEPHTPSVLSGLSLT